MNTLTEIKHRFKKHPYVYGLIIVGIIAILAGLTLRNGDSDIETLVITRSEFVNEISVSGKVVATKSAELGFDQSGRVAAIYSNVGDPIIAGKVLAQIDNGSARAEVSQKQAALEREEAKLASLKRGTRSEELAITSQTYTNTSTALVIAMNDAYLETESALLSKADTLFKHGNSTNPTLTVAIGNEDQKRAIEKQRLIVSEKMDKWKSLLATTAISTDKKQMLVVRSVGVDVMNEVKKFLGSLLAVVMDLSTAKSSLSQAEIDTIRQTINTASQDANAAASLEQTAYSAWASADTTLTLGKAGSSAEDIAAQLAEVRAAHANLANAQAQLRKTLVIAPFNGTVTRLDLKVGEIVSPSVSPISVMSAGTFEVESYIPEINIARIQVGNAALITLDAYGSAVTFPATIISIDPAETIRDGVSTYKTRLQFTEKDPRIKSGMTANIQITTERKADVISIPQSIIMTQEGKKFVQVRNDGEIRQVEVTTGSTSGLGNVEILSGLREGDIVILPPVTP